jgi:hypothetical protein
MKPVESQLAQLLLNSKVLDPFQFRSIKDRLADKGGAFHLMALELGLAAEEVVMTSLSKVSGIPLVQIEKMKVDPRAVACLPGEFCKQHDVFPAALRDAGKTLWLAMADPLDADILKAARQQFGVGAIRPLIGLPSEIRAYIQAYYGAELEPQAGLPIGEETLDLSLGSEEEEQAEFKITDMSGKTLVKHAQQLQANTPEPIPPRRPAAGPTLDERLRRLELNQQKAARIIQALSELLLEKGFFSGEDFHQRTK